MEKRYEGFLAPNGLYILDTFSGEVRFICHGTNISTTSSTSVSELQLNLAENNSFQKNKYTSFENEVVSAYPYLIAKPFSDLLIENDARMKCKLMVDTFTAVLKYLALQLASEYIRAKDLKDLQIHQTLTKDLSRPLISAWNLLIARCLPVMMDNKIPLFSPEIKVAYEKLESKCKDPFLVTQNYSDENGEIKTKTKKLGKIQALINYRNGLAHGFNQSQTRAQKEFDEYYPLLCDILQEIRFVSRYTLWHVESNREGVNGIRLMGASPSMKKVDFAREGINPAVSPLFLINDATSEILPLYAFFDVDEANETGLPEIGKDVFVFEGSTKSTVIYLSSSGEHLEKSTRFQHWKELLAQKQMEVGLADAKHLTLEMLHAIGKHISSNGIQALIASGKYLREATIPRKDLNEFLDSFSFSDFNAFVIGGESGIGKSTLLAQKTEEWQAAGHMVTFYRGSALNQNDIANKFLRDCSLKISYLEDFLSVVNPIFSQTDKKCYLIIDALNEYSGDLNELIKSIENIIAQVSNYPWFKIIVSLRDSAYNRVSARFGDLIPKKYFTVDEEKAGEKVSTNIVRLKPVSTGFVEQLYNAYRNYKWKDNTDAEDTGYYIFRPLTEFSELNLEGSTVRLLRSPLMARLVMQAYHRAKLPQQLTNDDAMRLYHDNIVIEKSTDSLGYPERKKLLNLLVTELDKLNVERLERDELMKHNLLRPYLMNNQRDSAYIQLLELGVLMEEWEADECFVRFAFDKFFEFLLAELHWPRINDAVSLISICKRATTFKILQGAIEILLVRFCSNNQSQQLVDLIDLADDENDNVKALVKDTSFRILVVLCNEYHSLFDEVINEFPKQPGELDLIILQDLLDSLYLTGQLNDYEKTMVVATKEAELLNNQKVLSDLMLHSAQYDYLQGRYNNAKEKLKEVIKNKTELHDNLGLTKSFIALAKLEKRQNNIAFYDQLNEKALMIAKANEYFFLQAEILNNMAISKKEKKLIEDAILLYDESFTIASKIGDKTGVAKIMFNKANILKENNRLHEAEKMYRDSLEILRVLGDKRRIAYPLHTLGDILRRQNKYEEAEKLISESLLIRRQLDDKIGISISLKGMGKIYKAQGKLDQAEKLHLECLDIYRQLGNKKGISVSLSNLGIIYFELCNDKAAVEHLTKSINLKKELGQISGIIADTHRVFSLMDKEMQDRYFADLSEFDLAKVSAKEKCWLNNIEMIKSCMEDASFEIKSIQKISEEIIDLMEQIKINDIDDLPVEAFYVAANKLINLNALEEAKELAKQALKWIGDRNTRRKEELEKILNTTAYNSVQAP
jgi:tetratricopeptide (TPR) repeat protein